MKAFLKENMVLFAGIALPLLLTLIFFGATQISKVSVKPPQHSVLFATNYYNNNDSYPYRLVIKDNQVRFLYFPATDKKAYHNWHKPRLFVFDPIQNASREIELPSIENPKNKLDQAVSGLVGRNLSSLAESPDGFVFEYNYRGGGNLMTEIFGGGYHSRSRHVLRKGSYRVTIPKSERYNSQFIGWIIDEAGAGHGQ